MFLPCKSAVFSCKEQKKSPLINVEKCQRYLGKIKNEDIHFFGNIYLNIKGKKIVLR